MSNEYVENTKCRKIFIKIYLNTRNISLPVIYSSRKLKTHTEEVIYMLILQFFFLYLTLNLTYFNHLNLWDCLHLIWHMN